MFTLDDLQNIRDNRGTSEERAQMDRELFLKGRRMYPTGPEEALSQRVSERDRGCYMMGFNVSERESRHA